MFPCLRRPLRRSRSSSPTKRRARRSATSCSSPRRTASRWRRRASSSAPACKIIDLAADFRLKDPALFERWYKMPHACPDLLAESGLRPARGQPRGDPQGAHRRQPGLLPDRGAARLPAAGRGGRRRHRAPDRRLQVGRVGRRPQGRGQPAVRRGVGQLRGLRRQGPSPPSRRSSQGLARRREDAARRSCSRRT